MQNEKPFEEYGMGPCNATDAIIVSKDKKILLIRRKDNGKIALPGGFQEHGETLKACCKREVLEETALKLISEPSFEKRFDDPNRDPRKHVISFAFLYMLAYNATQYSVKAKSDAKECFWEDINKTANRNASDFFADHKHIIVSTCTEYGNAKRMKRDFDVMKGSIQDMKKTISDPENFTDAFQKIREKIYKIAAYMQI